MKITTKFNLLSLATILFITASALAVGVVIIEQILYRVEERVLRLELSNARQAILQKLNRSGVRAAAAAAAERQDALRRQDDMRTARLYVIESPDRRVVYDPQLAAGAPAPFGHIDEMFRRREGTIEYTDPAAEARFAVFTTVSPINWLIGLSISRDEMLARKYDFLRALGELTVLLLCANALAVWLFGHRLMRRLHAALDCVRQIEGGRLSARIAGVRVKDEIGRLQDGINAMSAAIETRTRERASAEAALRDREARIRRLMDANIVGVIFWEMDGRITEANDAFLHMLGYHRDELRSGALAWSALTPPEYAAATAHAIEELLATGTNTPYEKEYLRRDGSRVPVLVGGALIEGSRDKGVAFVVDLTERKRAEAERQARLHAETANRAKSDFLATMSHELRTPLNAIIGYAQLLKRETRLPERQAGGLDTIEESGRHLLTLINDLLDLAKIEAGRFDLDAQAVALPGFLAVIANIMRVKAEEKSLLFVSELPPDLPAAVEVDEKRLRQVLLNLLGNAVKFTDRGEVRLRAAVKGRNADGVRLRFEVADTGVGIDAAHRMTIFQPFEQLGEAGRRAAGTGLGLSISRRLVEMMGGEIVVESTPGVGSRFSFELDLAFAEAPAAAPARELTRIGGYSGRRCRILVVDDVPGNRALLAALLGPLGFAVDLAADGAEAIGLLSAAPDLVITDLVMPGTDGFALIRALRADTAGARIPVIAVSASANHEDQVAAVAEGADRFLAKPIDPPALLAAIADLLHLEWLTADEATTERPAETAGEPIKAPPEAEMRALRALAAAGNMRRLRDEAARLRTLDAAYARFADRLDHLASEYQSQAISDLIERHLPPEDSPPPGGVARSAGVSS